MGLRIYYQNAYDAIIYLLIHLDQIADMKKIGDVNIFTLGMEQHGSFK